MIYLEHNGTMEYQTKEASGADIRSSEDVVIHAGGFKLIKTGVKISKTEDYPRYIETDECNLREFTKDCKQEIVVRGRSGLANKGILCHNGTIDSDYRGEIGVILYNLSGKDFEIKTGDRIAQLVCLNPVPLGNVRVKQVERDSAGFGTTGVK